MSDNNKHEFSFNLEPSTFQPSGSINIPSRPIGVTRHEHMMNISELSQKEQTINTIYDNLFDTTKQKS
jgi:hypothetical protein